MNKKELYGINTNHDKDPSVDLQSKEFLGALGLDNVKNSRNRQVINPKIASSSSTNSNNKFKILQDMKIDTDTSVVSDSSPQSGDPFEKKVKATSPDVELKSVYKLGKLAYHQHNFGWKWLQGVSVDQVLVIKNITQQMLQLLQVKIDFQKLKSIHSSGKLSNNLKTALNELCSKDIGVKFVHCMQRRRLSKMIGENDIFDQEDLPLIIICDNVDGLKRLIKDVLKDVSFKYLSLRDIGLSIHQVRHLIKPDAYPIKYHSDFQNNDQLLLKQPVISPFYLLIVVESEQEFRSSQTNVHNRKFLVCQSQLSAIQVQRYLNTTEKGFESFCIVVDQNDDDKQQSVIGWYKLLSIKHQNGSDINKNFLKNDKVNERVTVSLRLAELKSGCISLQTVIKFYDAFFKENLDLIPSTQFKQKGVKSFSLQYDQSSIYNLSWVLNYIYGAIQRKQNINQVLDVLLLDIVKYKLTKHRKISSPSITDHKQDVEAGSAIQSKASENVTIKTESLIKNGTQQRVIKEKAIRDDTLKQSPSVKTFAQVLMEQRDQHPRSLERLKKENLSLQSSWADLNGDDKDLDYNSPLFDSQVLFESNQTSLSGEEIFSTPKMIPKSTNISKMDLLKQDFKLT